MKRLLHGGSDAEGAAGRLGLIWILGAIFCCCALAAEPQTRPTTRPTTRATTRPVAGKLAEGLAWQIALEREGFSPGIVDGKIGAKTKIATSEFQRAHGLEDTGILDQPTVAALRVDPESAIGEYAVAQADLDGITPLTDNWNERAAQKLMGYYTVLDGVAERFHTSKALMQRLNPQVDFENLAVGTVLKVPAIAAPAAIKGSALRIELPRKQIFVLDANGKTVALFCCSIAANVEKRPSGETKVNTVVSRPDYTFDPEKWPDVKNVDHKLLIPPGPRNPVGLAWVGLDLPGYGIHGTPQPEMIGKTGSHGCFRMANWDAVRLAKMIRPGAKVTFLGEQP